MLLFVLFLVCFVSCDFDIKGKLKIPKRECGKKGIEVVLFSVGDKPETVSTHISSECLFEFQDVLSGQYIMEVHNSEFEFPYMTLQVTEDTHMLHMRYPRELVTKKLVGKKKKDFREKGYVIQPIRKYDFFVPIPPSQVMGYLKSPMVLFMIFGVFMVVVTPLISNTEEMREAQEMIGGKLKQFQGYIDTTYDGVKTGKILDKYKEAVKGPKEE